MRCLLLLTLLAFTQVATRAASQRDEWQLAPGFKAEIWADEKLIQNAVAISFRDDGALFAAETHRWATSIFDVTRQTSWLESDLGFRTLADRSNFLALTFRTNASWLTKDSERIRLLRDTDSDHRADESAVFADGFNEPTAGTAAGILPLGTNVWFACIPHLWKISPSDTPGKPATKQQVHSGFGVHVGVSGHDLHGLEAGPDGRIYFSIGDRGFHIPSIQGSTPPGGVGWQFSGDQPDTGAVFRCEPDGSHLEVFAIGLRNPQELAFDEHGNLFTGDNDTAGADDSRLLHVVQGGDYGWRCGYQHLPGFGPWVAEEFWRGGIDDILPSCGVVAQGPSGMDFFPGTGMDAEFRHRFVTCDFPGGIWDFALEKAGVSFVVKDKRKLLWNTWPTDVEFGPDGALYVADWVHGWGKPDKGRVLRITSAGLGGSAETQRTQQLLQKGVHRESPEQLTLLLGHGDQRVRLRAQWALAEDPQTALRVFPTILRSQTNLLASLHAAWGLGQAARRLDAGRLRLDLSESLRLGLDHSQEEVRAQCARQLGELRHWVATEQLIELLERPAPRVQFEAAVALGRLGFRKDLTPVLNLLQSNKTNDPWIQHAGVMALLGMAEAVELGKLHRHPSSQVRAAAILALRRLRSPVIQTFLNDPEKRLVGMALRAVYDAPIPESLQEVAKFLGKVDCPEEFVSRSITANLRIGEARNATILTAFASRRDLPEKSRAAALDALSDWEAPSPIDRIIGLWRPMPARTVEHARRALRSIAGSIMESKSESVRIALLKAAARLNVKELGHPAYSVLETQVAPKLLRLEAIRTIATLKHSRWSDALAICLSDPDPDIQLLALKLAAEFSGGTMPGGLPGFLEPKHPLRVRQSAFSILAQASGPEAAYVASRWARKLASNEVEKPLLLDVQEALVRFPIPQVQAALEGFSQSLTRDPFPGTNRVVLEGGDATKGRQIFIQKADTACLRCHQVDGNGGPVGPALDGIGKRASAQQILESILLPNAKLTPGYAQCTIVVEDGNIYSGVVRKETEDLIEIENLEDGVLPISRKKVTRVTYSLSAMPEGLGALLTQRELRDLVAFLAELK